MTSAFNQEAYANPAWTAPPAGNVWGEPPFWHPASRLNRPAAIALTALGFIYWWPVGLAALFYMIASKRMGCFGRRARQANQNGDQGMPWKAWAGGVRTPPSSGNRAFDEYRSETVRRLEDEQKEFTAFLERLRFAKDKAEFDQFMAERRGRPPATTPNGDQPAG